MITLLVTLSTSAFATTWTIDPEGGGDARTIEEGFGLLSVGDTLLVGPGTYNEGDLTLAADDVSIEGAGAGLTVLDGSGLDVDWGLYDPYSSTISGFTFRNFESDALALAGPASQVVEDCAFEDNQAGVVANEEGSTVVRHSIFSGNYAGFLVFAGADSLLIDDNVFVDNEYAVLFTPYRDYSWAEDWTVSNNTVVGGTGGVCLRLLWPWMNEGAVIRVYNNLFADVLTAVDIDIRGTGTIDHNLVPADSVVFVGEDPISASDNITGDAIFVSRTDDGDPSNDDLHLLWGSPGIDAAADSDDPTDYDGQTRPIDGDLDGVALPDIGAYEYDLDSDDDGHQAVEAGGDDCADADSSTTLATFYPDADGDGYGDGTAAELACPAPEGFVSDSTDCSDTDSASHPGAAETCGDSIDQDCNGSDLACADTGAGGDTGAADLPPSDQPRRGCETVSGGPGVWLGLAASVIALMRRKPRRCRREP